MDRTTPRVIWTGHPPPLRQVAGQIRTSTGVTYCARPTPTPLNEPPAPKTESTAPAPSSYLSFPDRLLAWLREMEGDRLPPLASIAGIVQPSLLGNIHATNRVTHGLEALEKRGMVDVWWGRQHGMPGALVVRVLPEGRVLRNATAPLDVMP